MLEQALDDHALASDALSRGLSSFQPAISMVPPTQGVKRKASNMESLEASQSASQTCPPPKSEPGSPQRYEYRGSNRGDTYPELHGTPKIYASSSSSTDTEDLMLGIDVCDGTLTTESSGPPLAAEVRHHMSSRDTSVPVKQEEEAHTPEVAIQNIEKRNNGLLHPFPMLDNSPPPHQQKASGNGKISDVLYDSIPDYAPPISTLPKGDPQVLQVRWREKPRVDLSNDPDRHMLHEAELRLAASLNLSCCAKYLCTKRRIFQARVKALQEGRAFRNSDALEACKINNSKASKISVAFEKVGWFDKKYFFQYLDDNNSPERKANKEIEDRQSCSSALTEPDIWDVSDSEFCFTSEGDEETTDDDTADSSVSFDGRYDETNGQSNFDSHPSDSLRRQHFGLSLIGGDGSQRRVLIERTHHNHDTPSADKTIDKSPVIEDRRSKQGIALEETVNPRISESFSGDETDDIPLLETRSMTQKARLALKNRSGDKSDKFSSIETTSSQQKSSFGKLDRRSKHHIPLSLDDASAEDLMLVKMKEEGRSWLEIEEAWKNKTGELKTGRSSLCVRYCRIKANLSSILLEPDDVPDNGAITYPSVSPLTQDQLLLATKAEIEGNFQREKAELLAEIESNFQSEKWTLVAEAMRRTGSTHYSADSIQAQYERLAGNSEKNADAKEEQNRNTFHGLPQHTTRTVRGRKSETLAPSRSGVGRKDEAFNATSLPQPRQIVHRNKPQTSAKSAKHSARMRESWATRRARGTDGHWGGPPKPSTILQRAKAAFPNVAPNAGTPLASTVTYQTGPFPESLPDQTAPIAIEKGVRRDANQHKQFLAHIVPAAPPKHSIEKSIEPSKKVCMP